MEPPLPAWCFGKRKQPEHEMHALTQGVGEKPWVRYVFKPQRMLKGHGKKAGVSEHGSELGVPGVRAPRPCMQPEVGIWAGMEGRAWHSLPRG